MTPGLPPVVRSGTLAPTPRPMARLLIVVGSFLTIVAIGLAVLMFVILPTPAGGRQGSVLVLFMIIGAIGVTAIAGGLDTQRNRQMRPVFRVVLFMLAAAFLGACWGNLR